MQLGLHWELLNDAQTSNPAFSLEGTLKASWGLLEPGYPGGSQQGSWRKALGPRWSLGLSTEPPVCSASLQSWQGKSPGLQGSPRGGPFPCPNLTATSMILLNASTCRHSWCACTHMSEKTCAQAHPEAQEATYVHKESTSAHTQEHE